jgi:hypothetical protein
MTSTFNVCGHHWHSKFDGKQSGAFLEDLDLAVTRARAFRIKDQVAVPPL